MDEQANVSTMGAAVPETEGTESANLNDWDIDIDAIYAELGGDGDDEAVEGAKPEEKAEEKAEPPETPAEAEEKPEEKAEPEQPKEDSYTLKHLDETRTVGRDEVIALAQKGMDYDRIREQRDAAASRLDEFEKWLKGVTGGQGLQEFRADYDALAMANTPHISPSMAIAPIKLDPTRRDLHAARSNWAVQHSHARDR